MMRDDIRAERVAKYGSFLFCPERDTICSFRDNPYGICPRDECILDDPGYIVLQRKIENRRKWNEVNDD